MIDSFHSSILIRCVLTTPRAVSDEEVLLLYTVGGVVTLPRQL